MWIIDSGATCHMCNNGSKFTHLADLKEFQNVTLGDGHRLKAECEKVIFSRDVVFDERKFGIEKDHPAGVKTVIWVRRKH
jgi:hypothetical protein